MHGLDVVVSHRWMHGPCCEVSHRQMHHASSCRAVSKAAGRTVDQTNRFSRVSAGKCAPASQHATGQAAVCKTTSEAAYRHKQHVFCMILVNFWVATRFADKHTLCCCAACRSSRKLCSESSVISTALPRAFSAATAAFKPSGFVPSPTQPRGGRPPTAVW